MSDINSPSNINLQVRFPSCGVSKTHASAVGVDDADSQGAVLHVALQVEHGALTS